MIRKFIAFAQNDNGILHLLQNLVITVQANLLNETLLLNHSTSQVDSLNSKGSAGPTQPLGLGLYALSNEAMQSSP